MSTVTILVPTFTVTQIAVGTSPVTNPLLFIRYNGIVYGGGVRIPSSDGGYRFFYPSYIASNNTIVISCQTLVIQNSLPATNLPNIGVYVIG